MLFDAKNISASSYVRHIKPKCQQANSKIVLKPYRHQKYSKTEMS